ncbi:MAG TPA: DUF2064 domain-containing protein [Thermoanaerobaculia bacterium]|jgi:glycosyltransferase A (GT-A) superfamily protein (DUF2064 family)
MLRHLVLFAREPNRAAREKGFLGRDAANLFAKIAEGWRATARQVGARFIVAAPVEDLPAWHRTFGQSADSLWIIQSGDSLGERLERTARCAALLGGHAILVGGDVPPSASLMALAFRALEGGNDAVLAPAPDGGVSLIGLAPGDLDLLRPIVPRRDDVFATLHARLRARHRRVEIAPVTPDFDGRRGLRSLLPALAKSEALLVLARRALERHGFDTAPDRIWRPCLAVHGPIALRGPPAAA